MKPWYKIIAPREDIRQNKAFDASEFAVHLDHIRDGRAPSVYQEPKEFFRRTFLTKNLAELARQVLRRLSGIRLETSAVFNLSTQFGGGKTHALTFLYHLAKHGPAATSWAGIYPLLQSVGLTNAPAAAVAVFVGTEFDSVAGRGAQDGTPQRKTPWGEIAFQLGGAEAFRLVQEHDYQKIAPGGDVIHRFLPTHKPVLILMDELMNYASRHRKEGLNAQLYNFLQNLSEASRARDNVVLAVSIPASELEMNAEDQSDFERYKKLLDRLGKPLVMSAETESSEIIRRRLFEWEGLPDEAMNTASEYAYWLRQNKTQVPTWFPIESAKEAIQASYPFHPSLLSVFERKWQGLPRFQQTRGILRLLALWVASAYREGYQDTHKDPLITLGTAPMEDSLFRSVLFEQLGEQRLEPAVTTDIAGRDHAHALRLDREAAPEIRKARLHRKVATAIFFESNGGQQRAEASVPEIRLAVGEPGLDIGNVETCLDALSDACYFLNADRNRYRFSFQANLNKLLADRRASVPSAFVDDRVLEQVRKIFASGGGLERVYFPRKSNDIPDRPALTLVILSPEHAYPDAETQAMILSMTKENGTSSRTCKSALIWVSLDDPGLLRDEARKLLAWKDIEESANDLKLDEDQRKKLRGHIERSERDLGEAVWRSYKNVALLAPDNSFQHIDLGLVHSSSAGSPAELIVSRLRDQQVVANEVSPQFLVRNWPPARPEWSTKAVRDVFYASPQFPRLLKPDAVRETIMRGVEGGFLAYVGKGADGKYEPFVYKRPVMLEQIELSEDMYVIRSADAEQYLMTPAPLPAPLSASLPMPKAVPPMGNNEEQSQPEAVQGNLSLESGPAGFSWEGDITPQKWMNFYMKILAPFVTGGGIKLKVHVDVAPAEGISEGKIDEVRTALRELGMSEEIRLHRKPA